MSTLNGISSLGMSQMPQAMSGASMRMPPQQKMSNLFQLINANGSGSITKAQFEQAFNSMNPPAAFKAMGVDAAFAKLDPAGSKSALQYLYADRTISSSTVDENHILSLTVAHLTSQKLHTPAISSATKRVNGTMSPSTLARSSASI